MRKACRIFNEALLPHLQDGLIERLDEQFIPCTALPHAEHGRYFVMKAGSSTNEKLVKSSDLAWISVDDKTAWDAFSDIFWSSGVADALADVIDLDAGVRLYSSFFVVRSHCSNPNYHTDWADSVGTNAFTLLAPLDDYATRDFHLLYSGERREGDEIHDSAGQQLRQYVYRRGEALTFASRFVHSTEPGEAVEGARAPHAFLCFTFGSDRAEHWGNILPTIGGYQSRILCRYDGDFELTDIGRHLRAEEVAAGKVVPTADVFA